MPLNNKKCYVIVKFMVSFFRTKDKRVRNTVSLTETGALRLNFFLKNSSLSVGDRQKMYLVCPNKIKRLAKFSMRSRNRCVLTTRAGSVFRYFRLSRITVKGMASTGFLTGVRKSSW